MKVQAYITDPVLQQKLKGRKAKMEQDMGMRLTWSMFYSSALAEWARQKDDEDIVAAGKTNRKTKHN